MKKQYSILIIFCVSLVISACLKDRLFVPTTTIDNRPNNSSDSIIKLYINEFLASNNSISIPGYANFPDWIEIYNASEIDLNLAGYFITDDLTIKDKYVIPSGSANTIIKSKSYLLIIADDSVALGPLHTNFSLSKSGESIGLFSPSQVVIDSITYQLQTTDKSYGRLPNGNGIWKQLNNPTPNTANY
jgi:hypothetical protein